MKKEELIELLQNLPEGAEICVEGYESGVDSELRITEPIKVAWNINSAWYYGKHEVVILNKENLELREVYVLTADR